MKGKCWGLSYESLCSQWQGERVMEGFKHRDT